MRKKLNLFLFVLCFLFAHSGFGQEEQRKAKSLISNPTHFDAFSELKKIGHHDLTVMSFTDERVIKILQRVLEDNPLKKAPREEVRQMIRLKVKGHILEGILNRPRVLETLVEIMKHPVALSRLLGIFLRKEELKTYMYIWLGILIFGSLIKRIYVTSRWEGLERFIISFGISLMLTFASLTVFYQMFYHELSPTVEIITDQWKRRNLEIKI